MSRHLRDDVVERAPLPFVEGVLGVAVGAAQIAAGQAHEDARLPGKRALALNAVENLVDRERVKAPAAVWAGRGSRAHAKEFTPFPGSRRPPGDGLLADVLSLLVRRPEADGHQRS